MKLKLDAHLSFASWIGDQARLSAAVAEFVSLSGVATVRAGPDFECALFIEPTTDFARHPGLGEKAGSGVLFDRFFGGVSLGIRAEADPKWFDPRWQPSQHVDPLPLAWKLIAEGIWQTVDEMLLCLCVARPDVATTDGRLLVDAGPMSFRYPILREGPASIVREALDLGWPELKFLKLADVWQWARTLPGRETGMGVGRVGRAFAAFSQVVAAESRNSSIDLVWAVMGLEALYATGKAGMESQIFEKSAALLGKPTEYSKKIRGIYNYRSRLVHGDVDVPFAHGIQTDYDQSAVTDFGRESEECRHIAAAILLATLQELVVRRSTELAFEYRIVSLTRE